uniref:Uncharacterized protein n=1 Tax=Riboviria sp. TaxID=2585031 RepID=A0A6M3YRK4_9VIRU|nr:MAG: hypothetical protein 1 [Riboviria sp.]
MGEFGSFGRSMHTVRTMGNDISNVTDWFIEKFIDEKVDPNLRLLEDLLEKIDEWSHLNNLPAFTILKSPVKQFELNKAHSDQLKILCDPRYSDHIFGSARVKILDLNRHAAKRIKGVSETKLSIERQETLGVMLYGKEGIGKSKFAIYFANMLNKKYPEASKSVYNVDKGVNFYEPYSGQSVGIKNEMFSKTRGEPFLDEFNKICSSDPYNFEGADLPNKTAPCSLEVLFMSTNVREPNLSVDMNMEAVPAFWDRILHLEVFDPQLAAKGRIGDNPHRRPDFSHLKWKLIRHSGMGTHHKAEYVKDDSGEDIVYTTTQIVNSLLREVERKRQAHYIRMKEADPTIEDDLIDRAIDALDERATDSIFSNAGNDFFMVRFQGASGTGKTSNAENLAARMSIAYGMEWVKCKDFSQFHPIETKPMIYILDEWIDGSWNVKQACEYVTRINKSHRNSVFIITTNTPLYQESVLSNKVSWITSWMAGTMYSAPYNLGYYKHLHPGLARRLGLEKFIKDAEGNIIDIPAFTARTYSLKDIGRFYTREGAQLSIDRIVNRTINDYDDFISAHGDFVIHKNPPPATHTDIDVYINSTNVSTLEHSLKDAFHLYELYRGKDKNTVLKISDQFMTDLPDFSPSNFIMDLSHIEGKTDEDKLLTIATQMGLIFHRQFPGKTFMAVLESGLTAYICKGRMWFYYQNTTTNVSFLENKMLFIGRNNFKYIIDPYDLAVALEADKSLPVRNRLLKSLHKITWPEFEELCEAYVVAERDPTPDASAFISRCNLERKRLRTRKSTHWIELYTDIRKHPVKYIMFGLLATGTVGVGAYSIYKLAEYLMKANDVADHEEEKIPNAMYYVHTAPTSRQQARERSQDMKATLVNTFHGVHTSQPSHKQQKKAFQETLVNAFHGVHTSQPGKKQQRRAFNDTVVNNTRDYHQAHEHKCKKCHEWYNHIHEYSVITHSQSPYQCPNNVCEWYYMKHPNKANFSNSIWIERPTSENLTLQKVAQAYKTTNIEAINRILHELNEEFYWRKLIDLAEEQITMNHFISLLPVEYHDVCEHAIIQNMLGFRDMLPQKTVSPYKTFYDSIRSSYVKLTNINGGNYAYHLKDGIFWTVGHAFVEEGDLCVLTHLGQSASGKCLFIDRGKDEAYVYCKGINVPAGIKKLVRSADDVQITCAAFMRCGPTYEVVVGKVTPVKKILTSVKDTKYQPNEYQLRLEALGLQDVRDIVALGDCAFPLVAKINGQVTIIGMHNAYQASNVIYFVSVEQERILHILNSLVIKPNNTTIAGTPCRLLRMIDGSGPYAVPDPYVNVLQNNGVDSYMFDDNVLKWQGFFEPLRFHNNYRVPVFTHNLDLENPNMMLPAAYTNRFITDTSNLVCNTSGRPDPGYTQILRITSKTPTYNRDIFEHAVSLVGDQMLAWYGPVKFIRMYEVLNGTTDGILSPLDLDTSAGPLMKLMFKLNTKKPVFDVRREGERNVMHFARNDFGETVESLATQTLNMLLDDNPDHQPLMVAQDCMKVENISADKASKGKVRIFNNVDLHNNLVLKVLFGDLTRKIMAEHHHAFFAIGQNPYITSTKIQKDFDLLEGELVNIDFKNFDKSIIQDLIAAFVSIYIRMLDETKKIPHMKIFKNKLIKFLTDTLHIYEGHAYFTQQGNNSGVFITTQLNCVVNYILLMYTVVRRFSSEWNFMPMLCEVNKLFVARFLGDDRTVKISHALKITMEDFIIDSADFCMECTPTKTRDDGQNSDMIDFCSREFIWCPKDNIVYPALKKSSICGLLYWFKHNDRLQVIQNLSICLYESALHCDRQFFDSILRDARKVADHFGVRMDELYYINYDTVRRRHVQVVRGESILSQYARREDIIEDDSLVYLDIPRALDSLSDRKYSSTVEFSICELPDSTPERKYKRYLAKELLDEHEATMASATRTNPVSRVHELLTKLKLPKPTETATCVDGTPDNPTWEVIVTANGRGYSGRGASKSVAKKNAYELYGEFLDKNIIVNNDSSESVREAKETASKIGGRFLLHYITTQVEEAKKSGTNLGYASAILAVRNNPEVEFSTNDHFLVLEYQNSYYFVSPLLGHTPWSAKKKLYAHFPGVIINDDAITVRFISECPCRLAEDLSDLSDSDIEVEVNSPDITHSALKRCTQDLMDQTYDNQRITILDVMESVDFINKDISKLYACEGKEAELAKAILLRDQLNKWLDENMTIVQKHFPHRMRSNTIIPNNDSDPECDQIRKSNNNIDKFERKVRVTLETLKHTRHLPSMEDFLRTIQVKEWREDFAHVAKDKAKYTNIYSNTCTDDIAECRKADAMKTQEYQDHLTKVIREREESPYKTRHTPHLKLNLFPNSWRKEEFVPEVHIGDRKNYWEERNAFFDYEMHPEREIPYEFEPVLNPAYPVEKPISYARMDAYDQAHTPKPWWNETWIEDQRAIVMAQIHPNSDKYGFQIERNNSYLVEQRSLVDMQRMEAEEVVRQRLKRADSQQLFLWGLKAAGEIPERRESNVPSDRTVTRGTQCNRTPFTPTKHRSPSRQLQHAWQRPDTNSAELRCYEYCHRRCQEEGVPTTADKLFCWCGSCVEYYTRQDAWSKVISSPESPITPNQCNKAIQIGDGIIPNSAKQEQTVRGGDINASTPQPALIDPQVTPNEPNVTSSVASRPTTVLNTVGPPSMIGCSGIVFDLKELVYKQFIDSDVQITFTDKDVPGTVLAAIGVDPLGKYINPYIKTWVKLHRNYCGPIMVQISIVGNPNMSSLVSVGWMNRDPGQSVKISELQKVSSTTANVCFPSVEHYALLDARQSAFYRKTGEDVGADTPHLVIAINTQAQSAFGEDKSVRIRIATRLAGPWDTVGAFDVSDPVSPIIQNDKNGKLQTLNF